MRLPDKFTYRAVGKDLYWYVVQLSDSEYYQIYSWNYRLGKYEQTVKIHCKYLFQRIDSPNYVIVAEEMYHVKLSG